MIDKQMPTDGGAGVNVDGGEEAGKMIYHPRQKEQPRLKQRMRHTMKPQSPSPRVQQHFPARARRRIARHHRVEVGDQPIKHTRFFHLFPHLASAPSLTV